MSASALLLPTTQVVNFSLAATGVATVTSVNGVVPPATANNFFALKLAESYYAELLVLTSAGVVDVALRHSTDGGVTYQILPLKWTQSAAAGSSSALAFKPSIGLSDAAFAVAPALTGAAAAVNIPFNLKMLQAYATLGTGGATTFSIRFTMSQKGAVVQ